MKRFSKKGKFLKFKDTFTSENKRQKVDNYTNLFDNIDNELDEMDKSLEDI